MQFVVARLLVGAATVAALSGFALAYGRLALHTSWPVSLAAGWTVAAAIAAIAGALGATLIGALATAIISLALAHSGLPRAALLESWLDPPRWSTMPGSRSRS